MNRLLDNLRTIQRILWSVLIASALLIMWQAIAYLSGHIPAHIMPLVHLLSGIEQDIPVAYTWTLELGLLSLAALVGSALLLICLHLFRKHLE